MVLSPKLELRQGQQLVMTPQLQQAIRLLQLSNLELASFVEAELERNPLLERDETPTEAASAPQAEPDEPEGGGWSDDGDGTMPGEAANRPGEPRLGSADRNGADHD